MNALVACEESQIVTKCLRELGVEAYSCDIIDPSGGHPEWHIKQDVLPLINGDITFKTLDHIAHTINGQWDLMICHPPCTFLTVTGNRWFNEEKYGDQARQRKIDREQAAEFFMALANARCAHIAIENPVGYMNTHWRKPDQIIQPYMFGDPYEKRTCLWLKGLPPLTPTNIVKPEPRQQIKGGKSMPTWYSNAPKAERAKIRSKTFPGFAKAMTTQWTEWIKNDK